MRTACFVACISIVSLSSPAFPAFAQQGSQNAQSVTQKVDFSGDWTWDQIAAIPGVDAKHVERLRSADIKDARLALKLAAEMDSPESVQLVAGLMSLDGTTLLPKRFGPFSELSARFSERPPQGDAGIVRNAALALDLREAIINRPNFTATFSHEDWPKTTVGGKRNYSWNFTLDFGLAKQMLGMLESPLTASAAYNALTSPVYDALYHHRSQNFYSAPITRERLALALSLASGQNSLIRYYRFANPRGLLNLNDVALHHADYTNLIHALETRKEELREIVQNKIDPYIPSGTKFDRKVSVLFAEGAFGWASEDIAGIDLEFFKDDYPVLINTLAHETYHVAQGIARNPKPDESIYDDTAKGLIRQALQSIFMEGTASFTAPPKEVSDIERAEAVRKGAAFLQDIMKTTDAAVAQNLLNDGVTGDGPFYYLGAEMSRVIVSGKGATALANTLICGELCFFSVYFDAAQKQRQKLLFNTETVQAIRRIP